MKLPSVVGEVGGGIILVSGHLLQMVQAAVAME